MPATFVMNAKVSIMASMLLISLAGRHYSAHEVFACFENHASCRWWVTEPLYYCHIHLKCRSIENICLKIYMCVCSVDVWMRCWHMCTVDKYICNESMCMCYVYIHEICAAAFNGHAYVRHGQ